MPMQRSHRSAIIGGSVVLPARQIIFDGIGDILADGRQLKHLVFDNSIVCLLGKLPIHGRLVPRDNQANP
jgi:hypothetical protein